MIFLSSMSLFLLLCICSILSAKILKGIYKSTDSTFPLYLLHTNSACISEGVFTWGLKIHMNN